MTKKQNLIFSPFFVLQAANVTAVMRIKARKTTAALMKITMSVVFTVEQEMATLCHTEQKSQIKATVTQTKQ